MKYHLLPNYGNLACHIIAYLYILQLCSFPKTHSPSWCGFPTIIHMKDFPNKNKDSTLFSAVDMLLPLFSFESYRNPFGSRRIAVKWCRTVLNSRRSRALIGIPGGKNNAIAGFTTLHANARKNSYSESVLNGVALSGILLYICLLDFNFSLSK